MIGRRSILKMIGLAPLTSVNVIKAEVTVSSRNVGAPHHCSGSSMSIDDYALEVQQRWDAIASKKLSILAGARP